MPSQPLRAAPLPLRALLDAPDHRLFASRDLDETRAQVGRVMKPHQLDVAGRSQRLDSRMHHVEFGRVTLSRLSYGADVDIRPGPLENFYLVQMPLAGRARIASGAQAIDSTPEVASVLSPEAATTMRWEATCDQIMLRIDRPLVERMHAAQLGGAPARALEFALAFRWRDCAAWRCLMAYLLDCAEQHIDFARHPLLVAQVEQLVVTTLMSVHAHGAAETRAAGGGALRPRHVKRVMEHLQANAGEPVDPAELAALAGVSLRSLYAGFKAHCGVGPMQYLKALRLDRVRAELQSADASTTVSGLALRWGFSHLGRFSVDYRARFGESPSETLGRR